MNSKYDFDKSEIHWERRTFDIIEPLDARRVICDGLELVQVCSTQYLSILWDGRAREAIDNISSGLKNQLWGSLGSNYLGGTHKNRMDCEHDVAESCQKEEAIGFSSGWAANFAISEMLSHVCDHIIVDTHSHNSVWRGIIGKYATIHSIDIQSSDLERVLSEITGKIVVLFPSIEGITGEEIIPQCKNALASNVLWIRDECHSFGVLGERGVEEWEQIGADVRVVGLSKAFGTMGAIVCGPRKFIDVLRQTASPWIFSTAVPPVIWKINRELLPIVEEMEPERAQIKSYGKEFRNHLGKNGIVCRGRHHISGLDIPVHIIPSSFEQYLRSKGFYVKISEYPSRPKDHPCARIVFGPQHRYEDVETLAKWICAYLIK